MKKMWQMLVQVRFLQMCCLCKLPVTKLLLTCLTNCGHCFNKENINFELWATCKIIQFDRDFKNVKLLFYGVATEINKY